MPSCLSLKHPLVSLRSVSEIHGTPLTTSKATPPPTAELLVAFLVFFIIISVVIICLANPNYKDTRYRNVLITNNIDADVSDQTKQVQETSFC